MSNLAYEGTICQILNFKFVDVNFKGILVGVLRFGDAKFEISICYIIHKLFRFLFFLFF
jgi:hypothetical protein